MHRDEMLDMLGPTPPPRPFNEAQAMKQQPDNTQKDRYYDEQLGAFVNVAQDVPPEPQAPSEPLPLRKPPQEQEPYPIEALGIFTDAVQAIADDTAAPLSVVASSVLASISLCSQGTANIKHEGRTVLLSLYFLSVLGSGERKSTVDAIALHAIRAYEDEQYKMYRTLLHEWNIENQAYETAKKHITKKPDFDQVKSALAALGEPPIKPASPYRIMSNPNIEGLYRLYQEGSNSLGLISDEGGIFLGGTSTVQENKLKTISTLSSIFSNGSADKLRMGEGMSRIKDKRLTIHLMVQPIVAEPLFSDALMQEQGFFPRFLITWPKSLKGTRLKDATQKGDIRYHKAVQKLYATCRQLLDHEPPTDNDGFIAFDELTLSTEAEQIYRTLYNSTEKEQAEYGELAHVSNYASRCTEQALRLAGVLTIATNPTARVIDGDTMGRASMLALWYLNEAKRIMEESGISIEILRAEKLLRWLKANGDVIISQRKMIQHSPLRTANEIKEALNTLQEHNYVRPAPRDTVIDGSVCRTAWEVLPYELV